MPQTRDKLYSIKLQGTFHVKKDLESLVKLSKKLDDNITNVGGTFEKSIGKDALEALRELNREIKTAGKNFKQEIGKESSRSLNKLTKASKKASLSLERVSSKVSQIASSFNRRFTLPLIAASGAAVKFSVDFNKGLANVATLIPENSERINEFKKDITDMSVETGKSLGDLTGGLYQVISAFGDSADTQERLRIVADAGVAGQATTTESLNLLSAVTKGYGDTSAQALQKVSDLSFMAVKMGQTDYPQLAASMGKVVPLARTLKTSQEELFAAFATLTGVTGTASEGSTQLASIYSAAIKPTDDMTQAAKKYGFASSVAMFKEKGLIESLKLLSKYADGSEVKLGKLFGRKEALVAALALLGPQSEKYSESLKAMGDAAGSTQEALNEQKNGINKVGFEAEKTKRRLVNLGIKVGDKLLPVFSKLIDKVNEVVDWLKDLNSESVGAYLSIGLMVIAIVNITSKILMLAVAIKALGAASLFNPIGIAIAALVIVLGTLWLKWNTIQAVIERGLAGIVSEFWLVVLKTAEGINWLVERVLSPIYEKFGGEKLFGIKVQGLRDNLKDAEERESFFDDNVKRAKKKDLDKLNLFGGMQTGAPVPAINGGGGGSNVKIGDTNINVNANGGDPKAIAKQIRAEVEKRDRKNREGIRKAARGASPSEE